jgi:hypothetical protein
VFNAGCLKFAATVAARAVDNLPETPMVAAGINVRYRFEDIPDSLAELLVSSADDALASIDESTTLTSRGLRRELKWSEGVVNVEVQETGDTSCVVGLNFHRASPNSNELRG